MNMEGLEKYLTPVKIWLGFLDLVLIGSYAIIYYFTTWPVVNTIAGRGTLFLAIANLIVIFGTSFILKAKPKLALEIIIASQLLFIIMLIDFVGGPTSFLFPVLYIAIIAAFFYSRVWGFLAGAITIGYILFYPVLHGIDITTAFIAETGAFVATILSMMGGYFLNKEAEKIRNENAKLDKVADKLTSEKSQDEAVLTAIADGVYAVDMDRNLVLLNKAAQDMIAWSEKDAVGMKCSTIMKLTNQEDVSVCEKDCPALKVWNTGEAVFRTDTCFMQRKNHKRVQLSSSYAPIKDYSGKMVGAICVFRDITQEKEVERLRNEFVSTASHELRTPITATEGYLSIITDSGLAHPDAKTIEFIGKAKATLLSMSRLIKNLLSVTKIEEGKLETTLTNFSIHDLSGEVIGVFEKQAKEKGIALTLQESKNLTLQNKKAIGRSLNVRADMEMIREVLNNLVENSIKFTEKGGVTISIDYDDEFATVNVEDTGMGMPAEAQKHLFEKFYRVDNTATREVGGTGLGLYITRSIVETFGGRIWVESATGKGSKFHFTVPLALD
jgi:PAS domain S-box-containing protein